MGAVLVEEKDCQRAFRGSMDPPSSVARPSSLACELAMVTSMWKLLGEMSVKYCQAAAWVLAAGDAERARALVEKANACLLRRVWHKQPDEIVLTDVLRER